MKKALFAGSFNPPTWGHIHLIKRAALLFSKLYIGIAENVSKTSVLQPEEKIKGLQQELKDIPNIEVVQIPGLVSDFARQAGIEILVRGIRNNSDFDYEMQMAQANYQLTGIETLFLFAMEAKQSMSSTIVRELAANGASLKGFVPYYFEEILHKRMKKR